MIVKPLAKLYKVSTRRNSLGVKPNQRTEPSVSRRWLKRLAKIAAVTQRDQDGLIQDDRNRLPKSRRQGLIGLEWAQAGWKRSFGVQRLLFDGGSSGASVRGRKLWSNGGIGWQSATRLSVSVPRWTTTAFLHLW